MGKIILEDIEVYAFHGHYPEENKIGGLYRIDLELDTAFEEACLSDNLEDTYDYKKAYDIVVKEMRQPSALVEHAAHRIVTAIFKSSALVWAVKIKLSKINPPIGGKMKAVAVEIFKEREQ